MEVTRNSQGVLFAPETEAIRFWVPGVPVVKGNVRAFRVPKRGTHKREWRTVYVDAKAKHLRPWQRLIEFQAREVYQGPVLECPVILTCIFLLAPPRVVALDWVRDLPGLPPDAGKLGRAVEDALQGVIYKNDAQVVLARHGKMYAPSDSGPGVYVEVITELEPLYEIARRFTPRG